MVRLSREDRAKIASADEVHLALPWPKKVRTLQALNRAMNTRYHMDFGAVGDADEIPEGMSEAEYDKLVEKGYPVGSDLFYNADLRSNMGFDQSGFGDPLDLVVWPRHYAGGVDYKGEWEYDEGFGETYWKKLLADATSIAVVRRHGEALRPYRPQPPGGLPSLSRRPEVHVSPYVRRRYYIHERDVRPQHRVWVGSEKWPSQVGMSRLRRHRKRFHPRAFRASIRKGVATRKER